MERAAVQNSSIRIGSSATCYLEQKKKQQTFQIWEDVKASSIIMSNLFRRIKTKKVRNLLQSNIDFDRMMIHIRKANMDLLGLAIPPDYFSKVYQYHWIVYAKTAFARPKSVIEYLGRYSHPVTNH
jgi:hypothetical protein